MTLPDNEIHLFIARPDEITDLDLLQQYESLLSDDEQTRLPKFYHQRHRHQYLVTRALQRTCLSEFSDIEPAEWKFAKGEHGKPELNHPSSDHHLSFNLSHTAGLIICGITLSAEIGVDVEDQQRSTRAAFSGLFSYFSPAEIRQLESLLPDQQKLRFFEHWTLKEAYIKARGAGFAIPLSQFGFQFEDQHISDFFIARELNDAADDWQFWQGCYAQRYPIAIALRSDKDNLKVIVHESVPLQNIMTCVELELSHYSND